MDHYWYISDAKIENLKQSIPRSWIQDLTLKLKFKSPWLDVEVANRDIKTAITNIQLIERRLAEDSNVIEFEAITTSPRSPFFRFRGEAARMALSNGYWIALHSGASGLLMGGSTSHAVGGGSKSETFNPTQPVSPSVDPMRAARALTPKASPEAVSGSLSSAWQQVFRFGGGLEGATLPVVEGIAVFAGRFPVHDLHVERGRRRIKMKQLDSVVVGSSVAKWRGAQRDSHHQPTEFA